MRIFEDLFTGTEVISDSYPWTALCDGAACEIQSRLVVVGDVNVDVGCGSAFGGKVEEDEEAPAAGGSAPVEKVNDLIDAFGYVETSFEKADWITYFKGLVKEVLAKKTASGATAEDLVKFKANAGAFVKLITGKFADLTIYTPKDNDYDHSLIYSYWKDESDEAPIFIFYLDSCKAIKV
jgi:hypothetical protein